MLKKIKNVWNNLHKSQADVEKKFIPNPRNDSKPDMSSFYNLQVKTVEDVNAEYRDINDSMALSKYANNMVLDAA